MNFFRVENTQSFNVESLFSALMSEIQQKEKTQILLEIHQMMERKDSDSEN